MIDQAKKIVKVFGIIIFLIVSIGCVKIRKIYLEEAPKADKEVFFIAKQVMEEYKNRLYYIKYFCLEAELENGIIETNWHPVGKGVIKHKIQIYVWGTLFRVDVWHKSFKTPKKDYIARFVELQIQSKIQKNLKFK